MIIWEWFQDRKTLPTVWGPYFLWQVTAHGIKHLDANISLCNLHYIGVALVTLTTASCCKQWKGRVWFYLEIVLAEHKQNHGFSLSVTNINKNFSNPETLCCYRLCAVCVCKIQTNFELCRQQTMSVPTQLWPENCLAPFPFNIFFSYLTDVL